MSASCDDCLRRGYLVGHLASRIATILDHTKKRVPGLLSLDDERLITAIAGDGAAQAFAFLERFDAAEARGAVESRAARTVCRHDPSYPIQLKQLIDAPAVLFVTGGGDLHQAVGVEPAVALVGARRASEYALEVTRELGRGLGAAGVTVVSGMALGVDGAAHRACLDGGGTAVAVLACGPDIAYPRTNRALYERIRERGVVVSELPPGQRAFRWSFPARNRIMAGLAQITVLVEAADPSGSMITANFAGGLGRTVGAVPGQVTSSRAAGTNALLKDGALFVTRTRDLLDELFGTQTESAGVQAEAAAALARPADPVESLLLEAVEIGLGIDGICSHAGLPVHEARAGLSRLEASGHVRRDALGVYRRTMLARREALAL